jgi:hypothetical protein
MGVAWTVAETGRLLASVDYCVAKGLEYRKDLAALMAVKEFERTPSAFDAKLRALSKAHHPRIRKQL